MRGRSSAGLLLIYGATAVTGIVCKMNIKSKPKQRRDPTTAPGSGDRVPYVIVTGSKGAKALYQRNLVFDLIGLDWHAN